MSERISLLEEIRESKGYDIALLTTFNFEIGFFERAILSKIIANGTRKVSLFVDQNQFSKALSEVRECNLGYQYMVTPIQMDSTAFHPKVILLLGEKKAKLFVGSANIKTSGYSTNNEIFNFVEYSENQPEYLDIIISAIDFFGMVYENSYKLDKSIIEEAKGKSYYRPSDKQSNGELFLLHNMEKAILSQVRELIDDSISEIRVATPYFDKKLSALTRLKETFPDSDVRVYLQNKTSTFPIAVQDEKKTAKEIVVFRGFEGAGDSSTGFYHGKVFLFKGKKQDYILYGSANCTWVALITSFQNEGNAECDFFEVGDCGEFDGFFDGMMKVENVPLETQSIEDKKSEQESSFYFKYANVGKKLLVLHVGGRTDKKKLNVELVCSDGTTINDNRINCQIEDDDIQLTVSDWEEIVYSNIFEIRVDETPVKCWIYSKDKLAYFRCNTPARSMLDDFEVDCGEDKYLDSRILLWGKLKEAQASIDELVSTGRIIARENDQVEVDDIEADDEFELAASVSDAQRAAYQEYRTLSSIQRDIISHYVFGKGFFKNWSERNSVGDSKNTTEKQAEKRRATSEEKRFCNYIKREIKGILTSEKDKQIYADHLLGIIAVLMEIFSRFTEQVDAEDVFDASFVRKTQIALYRELLKKNLSKSNEIENLEEIVIIKCLSILIENYLCERNTNDDDEIREIQWENVAFLKEVEKRFSVRSFMMDYVKMAIEKGEWTICTLGREKTLAYLESLYGYRTWEQLIEYIGTAYENANIVLNNRILMITCESNGLKNHYRPSVAVICEVLKYARNAGGIDRIKIKIKNTEDLTNKTYGVLSYTHSYSIKTGTWIRSEMQKNGSIFDSKGEVLSLDGVEW